MSVMNEALYERAPSDISAWISAFDLQMTIDGEIAHTEKTEAHIDPCTERETSAYPQANLGHADKAVAAAKRAFKSWSQTSLDERRACLERFAEAIGREQETLTILLACETGRPLRKAWSEVYFTIEYIRTVTRQSVPPESYEWLGRKAKLIHKPLGVAVAIAPWNAPVILGAAKISNALMAGDTQVFRPSPFTPLTALYLGAIAREIFPPGVLNVITGDANVSQALTTHRDVAKISFTGSTAIGQRIAGAAAPLLKRLTLELGGNDAAIVLPDADVNAFANTIFAVSLGNGGQYCAAAKRLYIHRSIFGDVREALKSRAQSVCLGNNFDPKTTMGPIQNRPQFERVWSLINQTTDSNATLITGAQRWQGEGYFIPPTLFEGVRNVDPLVDQEQFGPVLPLIPFDDVNEAIDLANDSEYGLGGSIWSADIEHASKLADRLVTGTAWINTHGAFNAALPMPSAKLSGIGTDYAHYGIAAHSRKMLINSPL